MNINNYLHTLKLAMIIYSNLEYFWLPDTPYECLWLNNIMYLNFYLQVYWIPGKQQKTIISLYYI